MPPSTNESQDDMAKRLFQQYTELKSMRLELNKGNEHECLELVALAETLRLKWLNAYNENAGMRALIQTYEEEMKVKKQELRMLKDQLTDARAQLASVLTSKQEIENERNQLDDQIELVKDLLKDDLRSLPAQKHRQLAFLDEPSRRANPTTSKRQQHSYGAMLDDETSPIDYDRTEESMLEDHHHQHAGPVTRSHKRSRSVPREHPLIDIVEELQPRKRSKEAESPVKVLHESPVKRQKALAPEPPSAGTRRSMNRSFSETALAPTVAAPITPKMRLTPGRSVVDLRTRASPGALVSWAAGTPINQRQHTFVQRSCLKPEYCDVCAKRVMFGNKTLKCSDCRYTCHVECRVSAPLPCVPRQCTPQRKGPNRLGDFTPANPPMIPHMIIHCVNELERRGLDYVGLYRIPGSEGQVNTLLNQFNTQRGIPNLRGIDDVATLTGCIKKFLQQLRDPLIPTGSWHEFVSAAEQISRDMSSGYDALTTAINELPMPHRDTLAYLIVHWQRVAQNADVNKMPLENMARVLAPTVVGHSASVKEAGCTPRIMEETPKQALVMSALIKLPTSYWTQFIDYENKPAPLIIPGRDTMMESPSTPELLTTMLGSVYGNNTMSKTPNTATRAGTTTTTPHRNKKFFATPWK